MVTINFNCYIDWEKSTKEIMIRDYPDARKVDYYVSEIDDLVECIIDELLLESYRIPYSEADVPAVVVEKMRKTVIESLK